MSERPDLRGQSPRRSARPLASPLRHALTLAVVGALAPACAGSARELVYSSDLAAGEPATTAPVDSSAISSWLHAAVATRSGDAAAAVAELDAATARDGDDPWLRLALAEALHAAGDLDRAALECAVADELRADPVRAAPVCARIDAARGDAGAAAQRFGAAARAPEADADFFAVWFEASTDLGDGARTEAARAFVARFNELPLAWRSLGIAAREADELDEAAAAFARAAELPGGDGWDAEQAARIALGERDLSAASAHLELCAARYREHLPCLVLAIAAARDDAERSAAIERMAARTAGDGGRIRRAGRLVLDEGYPDAVAPWLVRVAALRPRNVASLTAASWVATWADERDLAVELLEQALVADPTNFNALNFIAYEWAERSIRLDEAEVYVREAMALRPNDGNITDTLAWVLYRQGRFAEALEAQEQAVAFNPESAVLLDHLGDILHALGQTELAVKAWQRAVQFAAPYDEDVLITVPAKLEGVGARVPIAEQADDQ